jgi:hypothetical protein
MEKVIEILNRMHSDGIVEKFAIGGGIAAIYYLEAYQTDDIDVFISPIVVSEGGLVSFGRIYSYLEALGFTAEREYVRIEDWLVQFLPAAESVQEEAVTQAKRVAYGELNTSIFSAEHLAAELLRSGRSKDHIRVIDLVQSGKMDLNLFQDIVRRHGLLEKWNAFAERFDLRK